MKDLRIPQKKMVEDVLNWCHQNHFPTTKNHQLQFKIYYYQHKKVEGMYCGITKTMILYLTPDKKVIDIVDTILHEYKHYIDIQTKKEVKHYFEVLDQIGYEKHPLEISARRFANNHRVKCFEKFQKNWF